MSVISRQKLIIVTGSPCVGKTTVTDKLFTLYRNSAFFDGDWAWCVNPFSLDDPRLRNGDRTMSFALGNYLDSGFDYVFFSSVVAMYENTRADILKNITASGYSVVGFTLVCSEKTLLERHGKRGDDNECSFEWLHRKPHEGDIIVDTDGKSAEEVAGEMKKIIDAGIVGREIGGNDNNN